MLTLEKFEEASELVKRVTNPTKLVYSDYLSEQCGGKVYLKPENMQHTGAYKIRGAYYKISTLSDEARERGLITASAGNHAQGVAFAAKKFGCRATIVMPTVTPLIKVNRTKSYGADVILYGDVYDDAYNYACELAEKNGYTFVHPFNDLDVAAGQGTIAMEIVQELPTVDYIIVPVGGGGLIAGVSTLAKMLNPNIRVIGVEPSEAASMTAALQAGEVVELDSANTIADGTAVKAVGDNVLPYVRENVDDMLLVEDDELIGAFLDMGLEKDLLQSTASGCGACPVDCGEERIGASSIQCLDDLEITCRRLIEKQSSTIVEDSYVVDLPEVAPAHLDQIPQKGPDRRQERTFVVESERGEALDIHDLFYAVPALLQREAPGWQLGDYLLLGVENRPESTVCEIQVVADDDLGDGDGAQKGCKG